MFRCFRSGARRPSGPGPTGRDNLGLGASDVERNRGRNTPKRADQAQRLLDLSNRVSEAGDLRVICGDFNVDPGSETLAILKQNDYTELVTTFGFAGTRSSQYKKPGRYADYMLANCIENIVSFKVSYDPEVSDHCPLILDL